ncbi:MAG: hypothetical protein K2M08_01530 [Anaeroplasmataceae bacterium]|nr:hypothetical protein [Anaeroplasmataceae bacterium]
MICEEITIHTTPLEQIRFENDKLYVSFDDITLKRVHIEFSNILCFKSTYEDVWNVDLLCEKCFYNDNDNHTRYRRSVYEIKDSIWMHELKKQGEDTFQEDISMYHHFVLILGDRILEVVCEKLHIQND